ncbi:SRPBCC family protein [Aquihabitans sp. G128]|uniref:SRPBCC family protein n=1 Tax=Aquihabitans sp. G128 TaxID=2849779 RepID=UPI001C248A42|nr:SRPBCC family protein [Aquihabitans sp. G128]QXC60072.1 SRPBCC family protein [Aquihabitans sp. G128]
MWITRAVDAPAEQAWDLLVDLDRWPTWGPTVAEARLDPRSPAGTGGRRLVPGTTGAVRAVAGPWVPFRTTAFDRTADGGGRWAWRVAGVPATAHRVEASGPARCRVGFEVPIWAAPYAVVCAVALRRIEHELAR